MQQQLTLSTQFNLMIEKGDVVEVLRVSRWGGKSRTGKKGLVVRRLYLAYEIDHNKWEVLMEDGRMITALGSHLKVAAPAVIA